MSGKEIDELIECVFTYIPLIYPGIISVYFFNFCNAVDDKDIKLFFLKAVCIGYFYDIVMRFLHIDKTNLLLYNAILCFVSILCPFVLFQLFKLLKKRNLLSFMGIYTSMIDNDYEEMCSGQGNNYLRIYDKNKPLIYEGYVRTYEKDDSRRQYIILVGYKIICYDENYEERILRESTEDGNDCIIVYHENIRMMEKPSYKKTTMGRESGEQP